jgi:glutathione synthase/RimK-type ligase-like ATP-grasp enzyme
LLRVLTPIAGYPTPWRPEYEDLSAAIAATGLAAEPVGWEDYAPAAGDVVLPLFAWGYHQAPERWFAALDRWEAAGVRLFNPARVLRWNSDKRYLADLAGAGAPVVPTLFADALADTDLAAARARFGAGILVVKPVFSGGAHNTMLVEPDASLPPALLGEAMMIQPLMRSIATTGEHSLLLFDGTLSHALVKWPRAGDFRVQAQHGGMAEDLVAPDDALAAARAVLAALAACTGLTAAPLYARVDLIADDDGRWLLMELELIECSLFLDHAPDGGAAFARALRARIGSAD